MRRCFGYVLWIDSWLVICRCCQVRPFTICLSEDGTVVDDKEVPVEHKDRVMLLLKCSEVYCAVSTMTVDMPSLFKCQIAHSDDGELRIPVSLLPSPVTSEHNARQSS